MARAKGVSLAFIAALYICAILGAGGATFEIQNNCLFTVWAAGSPGGGKRLESGRSWTLQVPTNTSSGRFWGRTGCSFNSSGQGSCNTGDCEGLLNCQGNGANPVTLFEYTFGQNDFYDISLVDGFNLPMSIKPSNSSCQAIACSSNITAICPSELRVSDGCDSACASFNTPQYCCTGNNLNNCSPTNYSKFFKGQCPQAYSYPKDDATSTFTCSGGNNYKVIFCGGNGTSLQAPPASTNLTAPPTSTNLTRPLTPLSGNSTPPSGKKSSKIVPILVGSVVGTALFVMLCLVFCRCVRHWKISVRTGHSI